MEAKTLLANFRVRMKQGNCMLVTRKLKGPGKILVHKNVEVSPHDVLGHYKLALGFTKVNLAQELKVGPSEASKLLQKSVGQTVFQGELLASKKGLFGKSEVIVPTDGIFEGIDEKTGEAIIKLLPKDVTLVAGVFGVVQDVDHKKGEVLIKSLMKEIYGVCGTGGEREGFVNVISGNGELVNKNLVSEANRGQILVTGSLIMDELLKKALSCGVAGLVGGGLNFDDYIAMATRLNPFKRVGTEVGISVVAMEGFGIIPIGEDFFETLKVHNGKFAIIQGNLGRILLPSDDPNSILFCRKVELPFKEALGIRPEMMIGEVRVGAKIRLITPPFMGGQGEIVAIDNTPTKLDSGIITYMVTISTKSKKIRVPYSNLELI